MANKDFDRVIINPRERPNSTDNRLDSSQQDTTLRDLLALYNRNRTLFVGDSFYVEGTGVNQQVKLNAGTGFLHDGTYAQSSIGGLPGLNDLSPYVPMLLPTDLLVTLATPPGPGLERYDLIEVKPNRQLTDQGNRDILDSLTGVFSAQNVFKTLSFDMSTDVGSVLSPANSTNAVSVKQGVSAATGTATVPSVTAGYTAIAVVYVPNGVTVMANHCKDVRPAAAQPGLIDQIIGDIEILTGAPDTFGQAFIMSNKPRSMKLSWLPFGGGPNTGARFQLIFGDITGRTLIPMVDCSGFFRPDIRNVVTGFPSFPPAAPPTLNATDATALQAAPFSLDVFGSAVAGRGQSYLEIICVPRSDAGTAINAGVDLRFLLNLLLN